ncbi:hypothetical protein [Gordonia sp. NB41Y]|uniref:DUF6891 domain-containing protein n=1 Tax=Gordonia sp. NB41Y TaxID=875808 RepID=UPI0002BFF8D2|nr:hypothetical protein [Gordonia sp. NB41Y]WLP89980.1 hypothetical protein Q9K23_20995 [Gordonia sp. NB41Y]
MTSTSSSTSTATTTSSPKTSSPLRTPRYATPGCVSRKEIGEYTARTITAFEELIDNGVVARADFSCCGNCASGEIWDERDDTRHWKGYAYFHQQDTERLVETGETYIGYGAFPPEDFDEETYNKLTEAEQENRYKADVIRLLDDVVFPVLRRHGIEPEWNRDLDTRVLLRNADWYDPIEA